MIVVRFGSSGSPHSECPVGTIVVGDEFIGLNQNPDAFLEEPKSTDIGELYRMTKSVKPDEKLTNLVCIS